ncbi:unnamed protein product, partial [Rhizophagus irregularis]
MESQKFYRNSSSSYDEEKIEIETSKISIKKNSYNCHHHISISPDGTLVVSLNIENYQLNLYKLDRLSDSREINFYDSKNIDTSLKKLNWSLSVSNEFTLSDGTVDVLIAVSCFDENDMRYKDCSDESNESEEDMNMNNTTNDRTWIISVANQSRIPTPINNIGGIIKFLDNKGDDSTVAIIINVQGIKKYSIKNEKIKDIINNLDNNGWFNFFLSDKPIENFDFPSKFIVEMKRISNNEPCNFFIQQSLVRGRLIVEDYKDKVQTVDMYNLKTNMLENTFQKFEENAIGVGFPSFAISNNESLFAYCRGANSITIYLMENGLEVNTKKFNERNIQIIFFDFVQDDNKLLIVIEKGIYNEDTAEIDITPIIVIWDLFSSSDNCVRRTNDICSLFPPKHEHPQRLANSSGNLITITKDGTIIPILREQEIIKLMNPESNTRNKLLLNKSYGITNYSLSTIVTDFSSSTTYYQSVYNFTGKYLGTISENDKEIIIKNPEPWEQSKNHNRVLVYLNNRKSVQLVIGESTVQVWRKRKNASKFLEYIWVNKHTEVYRQFQIQNLKVGHENFSITLYIPSGITPQSGYNIKLEWPEKVNNIVDACQALEFLEKIKNVHSNPRKQFQFKNLIQQTQCIIKDCFTKKCGLWRMLDIRFDIMANLIRGNCVSIIRKILSSKYDNGKNKYLHIPRSYSWNKQIKETDLEIAIKCTKRGYQKDTIIVKYLLDYYTDNAIKTSNWMFTVSKAIPFLYEYQLEFYVKELFQKTCFGTNEIYLEQSNINTKDIIKSNNKNIHALSINRGLIKKNKPSFWQKLTSKLLCKKTTNLLRKKSTVIHNQIYMVPLPDFIVYPEGIDDKRDKLWKIPLKHLKMLIWPRDHIIEKEEKMSPFLRMVRNENRAEIYDNPSIAAIIDFKWNSAKKLFLRQVFIHLVFAFIYALHVSKPHVPNGHGKVLRNCLRECSFYWIILIGLYLLNIERIRIKYNGWKRYLSFYNFFDLFSVIFPLLTTIVPKIFKKESISHDALVACKSFAVLIISMELTLLLRYFEKVGAYVYIITNIFKKIAPFLLFMLIFIFGFSSAMFILLDYTIEKRPQNYSDLFRTTESVFFWTNGRWDQLDQWDVWQKEVFSLIGSVAVVTILQNMLIAIMASAFDDANEVSRHAALKYRAEMIAEYETIDKPSASQEENPRYIYFTSKMDYIKNWLKKSEKARESHRNYLAEIENDLWHYDDDCDVEDYYYDSNNKRKNWNHFQNYSYVSPIVGIPLSLYWFVDKDENN